MNKKYPSSDEVSRAFAGLIPGVLRGVQIEFFARRTITQTQFMVLVAIHAHGRPTMTALASNLRIQLPTATGIVDRLVKGGYVKRFSDPEDRRRVSVELTSPGTRFIQEFQNVAQRRWKEILMPFEPAELAAFHKVIVKLGRTLNVSRES